jgi:hypothetical protein
MPRKRGVGSEIYEILLWHFSKLTVPDLAKRMGSL